MIKFITVTIELAILFFFCIPVAIRSYKETRQIIKEIKNEEEE